MPKYSVTKSDIAHHKNDILGVLKRNFAQQWDKLFPWKYEECPFGEAVSFLAREEDSGTCVGTSAVFPRRMIINGQRVRASIAGDFAVDGAHRAYGPALKLQKSIRSTLESGESQFIYGFPNRSSEAVFVRIGYREVGRMKRYVKVLRSEYKVRERIRSPLLAALVARLFDLSFRMFSKEQRFRNPTPVGVETPSVFDGRFDALGERAAGQFGIVGERTAGYLNWRFLQFPVRRYYVFAVKGPERDVGGYVVYSVKDNIHYVADLLAGDMNTLDVLLYEFIRFSRKKRAYSISVSFMGAEVIARRLRHWGFRQRESGFGVLVYCDHTSPLSKVLHDWNAWYLLDGDNDT